ncbi:MAG: SGNH/GDSL hydrolase family protein [Chitinophagaceae bacterium]
MNVPLTGVDSAKKTFTYLALGDSYTIGQNVPASDNYPNQIVQLLTKSNIYGKLKIIATTGWTTNDLKNGISKDDNLLLSYDIVTLLIGVNNQYQHKPIETYKTEFKELLDKSVQFANGNPYHVVVLSIPDWGVTPFANGRDRTLISKEIDQYNSINKDISSKAGVNYLDITPWTREAASDPSLLASDQLHPSGKEYARWAESLSVLFKGILAN